ncbi:universal stress protein [Haloplanus salinus]|jgi:nucleotide-binding universal stress UspA family protein|uniref:Universal stress protein n=1 Tax=Haloplanus salinus TaxID=1126245 RepID=A0A368NFT1_9EURY|nr:universal stress protein [Haloplanus salinus]RCU48199.1 universal stress protein [Haloplanus salinus]
MSARVLVPVDGSAESRRAFTHATVRFPDQDIVVLHVIEPFADHTKAGGHGSGRTEHVFEKRQRLLDDVVERDDGTGTITTDLVYGRPVHAIPRYVETNEIDEVVMGSRGHGGTARLLLGSVADAVVRRVPVPVTVVRSTDDGDDDRHRPVARVLVPFDQSVCSRNALDYAFERFPDAAVTALFVEYPRLETYERVASEDDLDDVAAASGVAEYTRDVLATARRIAERNDRAVETATATGDPSGGIIGWIDRNDVDHVVIGCHGRSGVARWLLGSVAEAVVRRAPVPVTTVK